MIEFLTLCVIMFVITISWISLLRSSKGYNLPGPSPLPLIGNGHLFFSKKLNLLLLLNDLVRRYGNVFRVYIGHSPYVVIAHPKYAEELFSSMEYINKGFSYKFLYPWLGNGLLTSSGQRWKLHRKFLTPAFHFHVLQNYFRVFLKNEKILLKKLEEYSNGKSFNVFPIIALTALDNVTESVMGVPINAQVNAESKYVKSIKDLSNIVTMRMRHVLYRTNFFFNLTGNKKIHDEAIAYLHTKTKTVINSRRKELATSDAFSKNEPETGINNKFLFLDLLLLSKVNGEYITEETIREEVDTFMFEGHDTTTSAISFALYSISKLQHIQEKILEEQRNILGNDLNRDPEFGELSQMKYLEMVIKESLRLYPSVPLIERLIQNDCEISGMCIQKNTAILINIFEMQRNPDVYANPLEFNPDRFLSPQTSNNKHAFNWVPFSAGPRNCIGQKFAMMEMKVIIAGIVKRFKLLPSNEEPTLRMELILRAENGVKIGLKKR